MFSRVVRPYKRYYHFFLSYKFFGDILIVSIDMAIGVFSIYIELMLNQVLWDIFVNMIFIAVWVYSLGVGEV